MVSILEYLNQWKWYATKSKKDKTYYARRTESKSAKSLGRPRKRIAMEREIMNCPAGQEIDHTNRAGFDNRKCNLCTATRKENNNNRRVWGTSKFKGLYWDKYHKKWRASYFNNGKYVFIGYFDKEEDAYEARCESIENNKRG